MTALRLGPVIGRFGGASTPLDLSPEAPTDSLSVDLPDGMWAVDIDLGTPDRGTGGSTIEINGARVGAIRESSSQFDGYNVHVVARNQSGELTITSSSRNVPIHSVSAFPDPA